MKRIINYKLFLLEKKINELNTDTDIPSIRSNIDIPNLTEDLMRTVKEDGGLTEKTTKLLKDLYNYLKSVKSTYLTTFVTLLLSILVSCGNSPLESEKIAKSEIGVEEVTSDSIVTSDSSQINDITPEEYEPGNELDENGMIIHKFNVDKDVSVWRLATQKSNLPDAEYVLSSSEIKDASNIKNGQILKIPKINKDGDVIYIIKKGETLWSIADKFNKIINGGSVNKSLNLINRFNKTQESIKPGDEIIIPVDKKFKHGKISINEIKSKKLYKVPSKVSIRLDKPWRFYTKQNIGDNCDEAARLGIYKYLKEKGYFDEVDEGPNNRKERGKYTKPWFFYADQSNPLAISTVFKKFDRKYLKKDAIFKIVTEVKGGGEISYSKSEEFDKSLRYIKFHLERGFPVLVGVSHTKGSGINEGTTDHFIWVTGIQENKDGTISYEYVDTHEEKASKKYYEKNILKQDTEHQHIFIGESSLGEGVYVMSIVVLYNKDREGYYKNPNEAFGKSRNGTGKLPWENTANGKKIEKFR